MKAVIVAGGKGTRLGELALTVPKPMVLVSGKPMVLYQIELLKKFGITEVIMCLGHNAQVIMDYFEDGSKFGVKIEYHVEHSPLGTAGCLKAVKKSLDDDFFVFYGDIVLDMGLNRMVEFHRKNKGAATLAAHPNDHPFDTDLIEIDSSGRIKKFLTKPHPDGLLFSNLGNACVYLLSSEVFDFIPDGVSDFAKDVFPSMLSAGVPLMAYRTSEYIKDAGTPRRIKEIEKDIDSGKVERMNIMNARPAVFLDRDGVLNRAVDNLHKIDDFELLSTTISAIKMINSSDFLAIVVTNQPAVAKGFLSFSGLDSIHRKMETLLGREGAMLNGIYFCPHHPDKGFAGEVSELKIDCACRKPKTGLIDSAVRDFNIDLKNSFIVGDSFRDILLGENAGITAVGVRTGCGCKDGKCKPHYMFDDLLEAIRFILEEPYHQYFLKIRQVAETSKNKPFVISVAGLSRSGKSTIARYFERMFTREGYNVLFIGLDSWIKPASLRKKNEGVFERFQMEDMESGIKKLLSGETVSLKSYDALSREKGEIISYCSTGKELIILDGIVALGSEYLRTVSDFKIFCEVSCEVRKVRMHKFYNWKGFAYEAIDDLIKTRNLEENQKIDETKKYADLILEV